MAFGRTHPPTPADLEKKPDTLPSGGVTECVWFGGPGEGGDGVHPRGGHVREGLGGRPTGVVPELTVGVRSAGVQVVAGCEGGVRQAPRAPPSAAHPSLSPGNLGPKDCQRRHTRGTQERLIEKRSSLEIWVCEPELICTPAQMTHIGTARSGYHSAVFRRPCLQGGNDVANNHLRTPYPWVNNKPTGNHVPIPKRPLSLLAPPPATPPPP